MDVYKMKLILVVLILIFFGCSNKTVIDEIEISYSRKLDEYTIVYPPYNKINPRSVELDFFENNSFDDLILFTYNIETDNTPTVIEFILVQDGVNHLYTIEYPYMGDSISLELSATDFYPNIDVTKNIDKSLIRIKTKGDIDTEDIIKVSIKGSEKILKEKEKGEYLFSGNGKMVVPKSGHYAESNPPFIIFDESIDEARIKISKNIGFNSESTDEYTINGVSFLQTTNILDNGKWFVKIEYGNDLNESRNYSFFISDEKTKTAYKYNSPRKEIERPFVFVNTNDLQILKYFYDIRRITRDNILSKNILAFKAYVEGSLFNWNTNKIYYGGTNADDGYISFEYLPSHTIIMSLYAYLNQTNMTSTSRVVEMAKDLSDIEASSISNYSEVEVSYILAMSLLSPFDLLYNMFNADELLRIKTSILRSGEVLYDYLVSSKVSFDHKDSLRYASLLSLISLNMLNENLRENDVLKWYNFSMNYVDSLIAAYMYNDGSIKVPISQSFEYLMPIMKFATTLKNAGIFNYFDTEAFTRLGHFLSISGYPSGYTMPFGDNAVDDRTGMRYDNGSRNVVMDLLSREYDNALYKNYSYYGYSEALKLDYLPYSLMWYNYNNYGHLPSNTFLYYQYGYFKNIETVIFNENIFNKEYAYFALHAKGNNIDESYNTSHKDRLSFVYYNYGDKIIDEAGFSTGLDDMTYSNIASKYAHSIMTIDDLEIKDYPGTYTYIKSTTNYNTLLYTHAEAKNIKSYDFNLKNYSRRFYYIKPNIIVIKDNVEMLSDMTEILDDEQRLYTWRFTSKLPIFYNDVNKKFVMTGLRSSTEVNILLDDNYSYEITNMNTGKDSVLYIADIKSENKKEVFSPWVVILTKEFRKQISDIDILSFTEDTIEFNTRGRKYFINADYTNISTNIIDYTENRENVIILSD